MYKVEIMFGEFGKASKQYASARRGYPEALFYYLKCFIKEEDPILDLGCGTGISTRQLALNGFQDVQGVDADEKMLDEAREHANYKYIPYWLAKASLMPFRSEFFSAVTCFSSFHWFSDSESIKEIHRVLRDQGVIFIINKEDITPFKQEIQELLESSLGIKFPTIVGRSEMEKALSSGGFRIEETKSFEAEDLYSVAEALDYIQSTSFWPVVPEEKKQHCLEGVIRPYLENHLEKGKRDKGRLIRRYQAVVMVARKVVRP